MSQLTKAQALAMWDDFFRRYPLIKETWMKQKVLVKNPRRNSKAYIKEQMEQNYLAGKQDGFQAGINEERQRLEQGRFQAKTDLLKAAAEVAVTFTKIMYNINMLVNDKTPFDGQRR